MPETATFENDEAGPLDVRALSSMQSILSVSDPVAEDAPSPEYLLSIAEFGALPVDLAAALLGCSEGEIEEMIKRGVGLGWIRCTEYAAEPQLWASLRDGGRRQLGPEFGRRKLPTSGLLAHRRGVIEAHLLLREEKPNWAWKCEADLRERDNTDLTLPDGVLSRDGKRWAVEVERSRKLTARLRDKLERLCAEFDGVIYFGSAHVRTMLALLQASGEFSKLDVRPLPGEDLEQQKWSSIRDDYEPSPAALQVLRLTNEEGIVFKAQLPRLLGWDPHRVDQALSELDDNRCIRYGLEVKDDGGWIWCNHRGANRSGTGLTPVIVPSRGELVRRIVLAEVRLDALRRWPDASWVTRRRLDEGHRGRRPAIPRAVVECDGRRYAVIVLESWPNRKRMVSHLERWKEEYAGVLCYRPRNLGPWLESFREEYKFDWVEPRALPQPPASGPYRSLQDEWRTGRERYQPTEEEVDLLRFINNEGLISEMQAARALGDPEKTERLFSSLADNNCILREDGWIRCNRRGSRMSGTGMAGAIVPKAGYLEQRFELMEVRLSYGEPASPEIWKTKRQLGREISDERRKQALRGMPDAAVLVDGEWHAVALFFREFRRLSLVKHLKRWSTEFGGLQCYCSEEDLEDLRRFLARHGLATAAAKSFPIAPEGPARERQKSLHTALALEKKKREEQYLPKLLANKAVIDAVRRGELRKPTHCEGCGEPKPKRELQGHHEDYSRPLDVEWLCPQCHRPRDVARRHRESDARP